MEKYAEVWRLLQQAGSEFQGPFPQHISPYFHHLFAMSLPTHVIHAMKWNHGAESA